MKGSLLLAPVATTASLSAEILLVEGRQDSAVRMVIYEDLECPDCAAFRRMMDEKLLPRYAEKVAFVHRDFPLAKHAWARRAAIAAHYFAGVKPELGLAYRRCVLAAIKQTTPENFDQKVAAFAQENGLEAAAALAALADRHSAELVEKDFQDGVARGVARTPTVFVNGKPLVEKFSFEEISTALDNALAGR
jgi:protein-disulfide isomerase